MTTLGYKRTVLREKRHQFLDSIRMRLCLVILAIQLACAAASVIPSSKTTTAVAPSTKKTLVAAPSPKKTPVAAPSTKKTLVAAPSTKKTLVAPNARESKAWGCSVS